MFTAAGAYAGSLASLDINVFGFGSTSTLLPNGTVLFTLESAAQIYDPVSGAPRVSWRDVDYERVRDELFSRLHRGPDGKSAPERKSPGGRWVNRKI